MSGELLKAGVKLATALASAAFGAKVGSDGKKNFNNWKSQKTANQKTTGQKKY